MIDRRNVPLLAVASAVGFACVLAAWLPVPDALAGHAGRAGWFAALAAGAATGLLASPALVRGWGRSVPILIVGGGLAAGVAAFVIHGRVARDCTASYDGRSILVGRELTPLAATYRASNPQLSNDELLFDAAGVVERVWTRESIERCRTLVGSTYFLWVPCLAAALGALGAQWTRRPSLSAPAPALQDSPMRAPPPAEGASGRSARYDVFLSYRHQEPDATFAWELVTELEDRGYRVAIDRRDFAAHETVLEEMERAVRESRFTLAVVSPRYFESGHTVEEAVICKALDLRERQRRLIPVTIERTEMPLWLAGLVGVDCVDPNPRLEPLDQIVAALGPPSASRRP